MTPRLKAVFAIMMLISAGLQEVFFFIALPIHIALYPAVMFFLSLATFVFWMKADI
jgi:hypothetical protein